MLQQPIIINVQTPSPSLLEIALEKCNIVIAQHKIIAIINTDKFENSQLKILNAIKSGWPQIAVIFTGPPIDSEKMISLFEAGLSDYLISGSDSIYLDNAITKIALKKLFKKFDPLFYGLTKRETQVLFLLTDGLSSKEIASEIHLSPATIKVHKSRIMRKLNAKNLPELVRITTNLTTD